jgi:hypothetical protein
MKRKVCVGHVEIKKEESEFELVVIGFYIIIILFLYTWCVARDSLLAVPHVAMAMCYKRTHEQKLVPASPHKKAKAWWCYVLCAL